MAAATATSAEESDRQPMFMTLESIIYNNELIAREELSPRFEWLTHIGPPKSPRCVLDR
jgi:hypothetical protein